MSTEPALLWNALPPPRCKPKPVERIWSVRKKGHQIDAELRGHGEWGWEFQLLADGELLYGHRWPCRSEAIAEATEKQQALLGRSWELLSSR
jgi:hypothetical protein